MRLSCPFWKRWASKTTVPASQLPAVASAAYILGTAPERYRRWVIELPLTSEVLVAEAKGRWRALVDAEVFWTRRLAGYRSDARPVPAELEEAAATLRKGGLGKAFALLTGASRMARDLCRRLGVGELSEDLDALAAHIRAVEEFEADQSLRAALGSAWHGLGTPIDEVHDGLKLRDFLRKTVLSLPGGAAVVQRAAALAPDRLELLTTFAPSCKRLLSLSEETRARLDDTPSDSLVAEGRLRVATLSDFLAIDPHRLLAGLDAPDPPDCSRSHPRSAHRSGALDVVRPRHRVAGHRAGIERGAHCSGHECHCLDPARSARLICRTTSSPTCSRIGRKRRAKQSARLRASGGTSTWPVRQLCPV